MNTKQVIVWRNDLKVRTGKKMAMSAHASMAFLTKNLKLDYVVDDGDGESPWTFKEYYFTTEHFNNIEEISHWLRNSFRKIVCYVDSELELDEVYKRALDKGMISHMIIDNGATEFDGVLTKTCIAIGPNWDEKFIGLTDHLPLL
jgi:PTH2 family peptidyl-tRNA hydrolase